MSSVFSATLPPGARIVMLGTGGTIAGTGQDPSRPWAYQAAQLGVGELLQGLLAGTPVLQPLAPHLQAEQVAQVDSKDMGWPVWQQLATALQRHLADPQVLGVVVTHGTDTLEETAAWLHWLVPPVKPVVLTAAMRPATAPDADGPTNLTDSVAAVLAAHQAGQRGVVACLQGRLWSARDVRKAHSHALDAFDGGGASPLWRVGQPMPEAAHAPWPHGPQTNWAVCDAVCAAAATHTPRVLLLTSHADADGSELRACLAAPAWRPQGVLVACTGHGTWHHGLESALDEARASGVVVWRSSRVARGGVTPRVGDTWPAAGSWTAAQARLGLQLHLMGVPRDLLR